MKRIFQNPKLLIATAMLFATVAQAQQPLSQELLRNKTFGRFLFPDSKQGWIKFRDDAPYTAVEIFKQQPELLGLRSEDEMRFIRMRTDAAGNNHYRFAQFYKGVRVESVEHLVHEKDGKVYLMNGHFIPDLNFDTTPTISSGQAIAEALKAVPAEKYLWQDENEESRYRYKKNDSSATLYPQPELLIVKKDANSENVASNYVLAYKMHVLTNHPRKDVIVYVDAHSGEMIRTKNAELNCEPPIYPLIECTNNFHTWQLWCVSTSHYGTQMVVLRNDGCSDLDPISNDGCYNGGSDVWSYDAADDTYCGLNNTYYGGTYSQIMGSTALWCSRQVMISFILAHDFEGFSGTGNVIDIFNDATFYDDNNDPYYTNSGFDPVLDNIYLGRGASASDSSDDWNTIDIVGHEFTHGVINDAHIDDLDDDGEAGALNEGLCDFYGEWATVVSGVVDGDWLFGGEKSDGAIRSFSNPKSLGDPDTYLGTNWYSGAGDNGGVHANCSVIDYCLYLMSEGGSGTNDLGDSYDVTPLSDGIYTVESIAWQAMMNYIDGSDDFEIARNCFIQAAIDLYGSCSDEVLTVAEAFNAVGIAHYTTLNLTSMCGTYNSSTTIDAIEGVANASISNYEFSTSCNTTVTSTVTAKSGNFVQFFPGFSASSGCTFTAFIEPCSKSNYDPDNLKISAGHSSSETVSSFKDEMNLSPNPADEFSVVTIRNNDESSSSLLILDMTGKIEQTVFSDFLIPKDAFETNINTSQLKPGIYLCLLKSGGQMVSQKFVVSHQ